jgi:hypothetical protein
LHYRLNDSGKAASCRVGMAAAKEPARSMTISVFKTRLLALAAFAIAGSVFAADANSGAAAKEAAMKEAAKKEAANKEAEAKANQQTVMEQLKDQAARFSKDHDALLKELNSVTAEKRKEILQKMEERKKEFEEKLSALHKQMRDEQRKQRQGGIPKKQ